MAFTIDFKDDYFMSRSELEKNWILAKLRENFHKFLPYQHIQIKNVQHDIHVSDYKYLMQFLKGAFHILNYKKDIIGVIFYYESLKNIQLVLEIRNPQPNKFNDFKRGYNIKKNKRELNCYFSPEVTKTKLEKNMKQNFTVS